MRLPSASAGMNDKPLPAIFKTATSITASVRMLPPSGWTIKASASVCTTIESTYQQHFTTRRKDNHNIHYSDQTTSLFGFLLSLMARSPLPPWGFANAARFLANLQRANPVETECSIIEVPFDDGIHRPITIPSCGHICCYDCIERWVNGPEVAHNRCPFCRDVMFDNGLPTIEQAIASAERRTAQAEAGGTGSDEFGFVNLADYENPSPYAPQHMAASADEQRFGYPTQLSVLRNAPTTSDWRRLYHEQHEANAHARERARRLGLTPPAYRQPSSPTAYHGPFTGAPGDPRHRLMLTGQESDLSGRSLYGRPIGAPHAGPSQTPTTNPGTPIDIPILPRPRLIPLFPNAGRGLREQAFPQPQLPPAFAHHHRRRTIEPHEHRAPPNFFPQQPPPTNAVHPAYDGANTLGNP
jgi:hypothetical protein